MHSTAAGKAILANLPDYRVDEIKGSYRPQVLPLVLQELETTRALGLVAQQEHARQVQIVTQSTVRPGARLHVLAIGVNDYGAQARHLRLDYAHQDARDVASALLNTQCNLYADVEPQVLRDDEATEAGIMEALEVIRAGMARGVGQDLAVVLFAGHGAMVGDKFYLLPHGVDMRTTALTKATALAIDVLRDELVSIAAHGRVLALLDCCRSGAMTADGTKLTVNADVLKTALAAGNVTVLTSSSGAEESYEDAQWQNGAFTEVFLKALAEADADHDGLIGVNDLMGYMTKHVSHLTDGRQTPGIEIRYHGDLFVAAL